MHRQYIPNARLTEGQTYLFKILKLISLGPSDNWYALQDPYGYKILMQASYYDGYGLKAGQDIRCRVDKVNCNGRVYLEPEHPCYKWHQVYPFDVVNAGKRINIAGQPELFMVVSDRLGKHWKVLTFNPSLISSPPEVVQCRIDRIKKGKLYLSLPGETADDSGLLPGSIYSFLVKDEKVHPDNGHLCYILEDSKGKAYYLRKKHYLNYGFRTGQLIQCVAGSLTYDQTVRLEPLHPCYELGRTYEFEISRFEELVFSDGSVQKVLVLRDCFREDVRLHIDDAIAHRLAAAEKVQARVVNVYKSRPELELLESSPSE